MNVDILNKALNALTRSVADIASSVTSIATGVVGTNDAGTPTAPSYDTSGHMEVAVHGPLLPFGSVHTEKMTPVFQVDSVYGINPQQMTATTGRAIAGASSATTSGLNNVFKVATGTTSYSFATLQTRKRLRYRAGQGII